MSSPALAQSPPQQHTKDNVIGHKQDASPPPPARDPAQPSQTRPPPKPKRSNFDLEPNPFEQSFARPSNDSSLRTQQKSPDSSSRSAPSLACARR